MIPSLTSDPQVSREEVIHLIDALLARTDTAKIWIFRRLDDATLVEKADPEARGTIRKHRRLSVMG